LFFFCSLGSGYLQDNYSAAIFPLLLFFSYQPAFMLIRFFALKPGGLLLFYGQKSRQRTKCLMNSF